MQKPRKTPLRKCLGCGQTLPKKELIRVVLSPEEAASEGGASEREFSIDITGKKPGRGAYLCKSESCLAKAYKSKGLERSFKRSVPPKTYEALREGLTISVVSAAANTADVTAAAAETLGNDGADGEGGNGLGGI